MAALEVKGVCNIRPRGGYTKEQCDTTTVGGVFSWTESASVFAPTLHGILWRGCVDPGPVPVPALIERGDEKRT